MTHTERRLHREGRRDTHGEGIYIERRLIRRGRGGDRGDYTLHREGRKDTYGKEIIIGIGDYSEIGTTWKKGLRRDGDYTEKDITTQRRDHIQGKRTTHIERRKNIDGKETNLERD